MDVKPGEYAKDIDLGFMSLLVLVLTRLSDLELTAKFVKGKHIAPTLTAIVVPGSRQLRKKLNVLVWIKFSWMRDLNGVIRLLNVLV